MHRADAAPSAAADATGPALSAPAPDAPSLASSTTEPQQDPAKPFMSKGEKLHKWGTYLGVDWIFNAAAGVAFAYWGKYTATGQKCFSGPVKRGFEMALRPVIKDPQSLKSSVEYGNMFVSIITGGMFTIPPLMVLEKNENKKSITRFLDKLIYGAKTVEEDPKFAQSYQRILEEPRKDFMTGMGSRFVALSPLLASVLFPPTRNLLDRHYFSHITRASTALSTRAGLGAQKLFPALPRAQALERNAFIHDNFALDFGFGVPYALLHAVFYNKFAGDKKQQAPATPGTSLAETLPAEIRPPETSPPDAPQPAAKQWAAGMERKSAAMLSAPAAAGFIARAAERPDMGPRLA